MSISHNGTNAANQALDYLRGKPNPFDNLVRPQRPDDRFLDLHVPELLKEPRELLLQVIDAYRLLEYRAVSDLPDSRVVTILGRRGAGKTHLLESIAHRDDGQRQLLVRVNYFDPDLAFEEFLLARIINALLTEDPVHGGRPFEDLALAVTRRLLRVALAELGPVERMLLSAPATGLPWRLYWNGGNALAGKVDEFLEELTAVPPPGDIAALAKSHGFDPAALLQLIVNHVQRWEKSDDALPAIRRQLYPSLAKAALLHETDIFTEFLESDYNPRGARPFYRSEIVNQLLIALVETCALVRLPAVFAFDNLEGLLAAQGQLEGKRARALFDYLAQAVDSSRGLLFLLFAEAGLYQEIRKQTNTFAQSRVDLGVPVHGRGPIADIELRPPTADEMDKLISNRVSKLLNEVVGTTNLPPFFPFETGFLADLHARKDQELRNKLLRLRDEYSRVVYQRSVSSFAPELPAKDWGAELNRSWNDQLAAARKRVRSAGLGSGVELFVGLRKLLEQISPWQSHGLVFTRSLPMSTTGYANCNQVNVVDWCAPEANGEAQPAFRICVGFLLAGGNVMWRDLEAKFKPLQGGTRQPDAVVVLWPAESDKELPEKTKEVWDKNSKKTQAVLHHIVDEDLHMLLGLPDWISEVRSETVNPVPESTLRDFLRSKCQTLLSLVEPTAKERLAANAH